MIVFDKLSIFNMTLKNEISMLWKNNILKFIYLVVEIYNHE